MATESKSTQEETGRKKAREKVGDGIRQGIGVLSAFKDALEETINEARERGDLSADRAKEIMKGALGKAQAAAAEARERLDFATQAEHDALRESVEELRRRVAALEAEANAAKEGEGPGGP
jgi:polyhydroxyalkanoate synthesis regulator phasin